MQRKFYLTFNIRGKLFVGAHGDQLATQPVCWSCRAYNRKSARSTGPLTNAAQGHGTENGWVTLAQMRPAPKHRPCWVAVIVIGALLATAAPVRLMAAPATQRMNSAARRWSTRWRIAGGKIVEHWDDLQDVPAQTASGNAMFSDVYSATAGGGGVE